MFVAQENVEPTNNHAERVLRRGVLWRKSSFGCTSERGCRFVERLLSVGQTLRLQRRPVLAFLVQSLNAHRTQQTKPALIERTVTEGDCDEAMRRVDRVVDVYIRCSGSRGRVAGHD